VFKRAYQKLASKFYGLYPVEEKIGNVAYKLKLPLDSRIHPDFHMSLQKKKSWGETIIANSDLPLMADDGDLLIELEVILDTRWVKQRSIFIEESLVQCKRLPVDYATWENSQELCDKFININLKDKVSVTGGSIDKPKRSLRVLVKNPKYLD